MNIAELGVIVRPQGVTQTARELDTFNRSAGTAERTTSTLAATMKRAAAAFAATGAAYLSARAILSNARAYENLTGKMRLFLQDQRQLVQAQTQLFNISQRAGVELEGVTDLYVKLSQASDDLRGNQTKLLRVVELFSKGLTVSGADTAAAAASTRQFAQAMASGTLRGDEFVSVMEGAPRVARALADGLNVPIGKLRDLAAEGKLTAETVTAALLRGGKAIDDEFNRMPLTIDRAMQKVKNSFLQLIGQTNQAAGATREMAKAVDQLGSALGNPQTIAAFQETVTWLAKIAAGAFNAASALREFYGANQDKSTVSLQNRRVQLETELFRLQRRSGLGLADARDPIAAMLGLPADTQAQIKAKQAELQQIEALLQQRRRLGDDWREGRVVSRNGGGRRANVNTTGAPGVLDTATGEVTERRARALRSIVAPAREATQALQDYASAEQAIDAARWDAEDRKSAALVAFERIRAELNGPLAVAQFDHIERMHEIARLGRESGTAADVIEAAQKRQEEAYKKTTAAILEQQNAMQNPELVRAMDTFRRGAADALTDFVTDAKSAKDALKDFADYFAETITKMIADQWMQKLFGQMGTTQTGSAGGGLWSLIGGLLGGQRASGGPVSAGRLYEVNERGAPELFEAGGRQYLLPPRSGNVRPMAPAQAAGNTTFQQTIVMHQTLTRRTSEQVARQQGEAAQKALRRR